MLLFTDCEVLTVRWLLQLRSHGLCRVANQLAGTLVRARSCVLLWGQATTGGEDSAALASLQYWSSLVVAVSLCFRQRRVLAQLLALAGAFSHDGTNSFALRLRSLIVISFFCVGIRSLFGVQRMGRSKRKSEKSHNKKPQGTNQNNWEAIKPETARGK